ncbi:MAG TPA: hypothetical protein PKZ14_07525, partial [Chitinophagales bacterium]|nr:hypothetical protein [Chitinophagales bacterium]
LANEILVEIQQDYPSFLISTAGDFRRKKITLEGIDFLMALEDDAIQTFILEKYKQYPVYFEFCSQDDFYLKLLQMSSDKEHFGFLSFKLQASKYTSENQIYEEAGFPFIAPELRDNQIEWKLVEENKLDKLVDLQDIKGVVHAHSTYSDGTNTLEDLATYCKHQG